MRFLACLILLSCAAAFAGCAAPQRTFVSNNDHPESELPKPTASSAPKSKPRVTSPSTHADPNKPERSVWSKWLGAFSGSPAKQEPPKPTSRIPLPRTDQDPKTAKATGEADESAPYSGF